MSEELNSPTREPLTAMQKVLLEHKLTVRRILLDRLLIGLLLVLAALLASLTVERYKAKAAEKLQFLDRRHEAASQIRLAMTAVTSAAFAQTLAPCALDLANRPPTDKLKLAVTDLMEKGNSASILLSDIYRSRLDLIANIFHGAAANQSAIACDSRYFFNDVADYFTEATRIEILGSEEMLWSKHTPLSMTKEQMDAFGAREYFVRSQENWRKSRAKDQRPHGS